MHVCMRVCACVRVCARVCACVSLCVFGLAYRSPNINKEDITKMQNVIKKVSKGECIIMGDFNHGHIQWKSLEYRG